MSLSAFDRPLIPISSGLALSASARRCHNHWRRPHARRRRDDMATAATRPPGPKGTWLGGNLPEFRRAKLDFLTHCARTYGDVVALRLGPHRIYLLSHPDLIEEV